MKSVILTQPGDTPHKLELHKPGCVHEHWPSNRWWKSLLVSTAIIWAYDSAGQSLSCQNCIGVSMTYPEVYKVLSHIFSSQNGSTRDIKVIQTRYTTLTISTLDPIPFKEALYLGESGSTDWGVLYFHWLRQPYHNTQGHVQWVQNLYTSRDQMPIPALWASKGRYVSGQMKLGCQEHTVLSINCVLTQAT